MKRLHGYKVYLRKLPNKLFLVTPSYLLRRFGGLDLFRLALPPVIAYPLAVNPNQPDLEVPGFLFEAKAFRTEGRPEMLDDWGVDAPYSLWQDMNNGIKTISLGIQEKPGINHVFTVVGDRRFIVHTVINGPQITTIELHPREKPIWEVRTLRDTLRSVHVSLQKSKSGT